MNEKKSELGSLLKSQYVLIGVLADEPNQKDDGMEVEKSNGQAE